MNDQQGSAVPAEPATPEGRQQKRVIEAIEIERFRGIRTGKLDDLAEVNVLIGRNGCGKSTVCEAVARAFQAARGDPLGRVAHSQWSAQREEKGDTFDAGLWFGGDTTESLSVLLRREGGVRFGVGGEGSSLSWSGAPPTASCATFLPEDGKNRLIENNGWTRLLAARGDKAVVSALNDAFGLNWEGISLPPDGNLIALSPTSGIRIGLHGEGIRTALRMLIFLRTLQGWIVNLEEPECHQHPGALKKLALAVCQQAKPIEQQLIVTTHSETCIDAFLDGAEKAGMTAAVYHLALDDHGTLSTRRFSPKDIRELEAMGADVRFTDLYA